MNNRVNFSLVLIILVLINLKIILVNEETLILICFITFCFLATSRLSNSTKQYFENQQKLIKSEFLASSEKMIQITEQKKNSIKKTLVWSGIFLTLKNDFNNFNQFLLQQFRVLYHIKFQQKIEKKLEYSNRLELQLTKLIILVIIEKLTKITKLQNFCTDTLNIPSLKTVKKIYFREHLQKIIN